MTAGHPLFDGRGQIGERPARAPRVVFFSRHVGAFASTAFSGHNKCIHAPVDEKRLDWSDSAGSRRRAACCDPGYSELAGVLSPLIIERRPSTPWVTSPAATWYSSAGSAATGGQFQYTQQFKISGGTSANLSSVTVTVTSQTSGTSPPVTINLQ